MKSCMEYLTENFQHAKQFSWNEETFVYFEVPELLDCRILMTLGLSDFKMKVHSKYVGEEFAELYMYLPPYWDKDQWKEPENEWVLSCLSRAKDHVIKNNTWFGHGHTFTTQIEGASIFEGTEQRDYMISDPVALKKQLRPFKEGDREIRFLAVFPIYRRELDYKEAKGTFKMFEKFDQYRVSEKMDGYRDCVVKSRWSRLFKR